VFLRFFESTTYYFDRQTGIVWLKSITHLVPHTVSHPESRLRPEMQAGRTPMASFGECCWGCLVCKASSPTRHLTSIDPMVKPCLHSGTPLFNHMYPGNGGPISSTGTVTARHTLATQVPITMHLGLLYFWKSCDSWCFRARGKRNFAWSMPSVMMTNVGRSTPCGGVCQKTSCISRSAPMDFLCSRKSFKAASLVAPSFRILEEVWDV
jgi:hypothetical protein